MKKSLIISFLVFSLFTFSQKKEMVETFLKGNYNKTIELGQKIIETEPNDFETNLMILRAYNEKSDYTNAYAFVQKCKSLMKQDWEKSWTLTESTITNFGIGNIDEARKNFNEAKQIRGTKNSEKKLKEIGLVLGFDEIYNNWKTRDSQNIFFHFENTISDEEIEKIVLTRQKAFDEINTYFKSSLPKKIDFFVWNQKENYNQYLNNSLGFTKPNYCVSHNRMNQTSGHEIAHNVSFWKNTDNIRTKFINEGIGVCFDQQKNNKLKIAKEVYKKNSLDIKDAWKNQTKLNDDVLYPISGAFVEYLLNYDKNKFLNLVENQTYV